MDDTKQTVGDFELWNFAENHIQATLYPTPKYLILTGGEDTLKLIVPFPHRLIKMVLRHTDSANADAITPLDVQVRRDVGQISSIPLGKDIVQTQDDLIDPLIILTFGDGFEYESTTWTLSFTGTATDRVHPVIYIQRLGGR